MPTRPRFLALDAAHHKPHISFCTVNRIRRHLCSYPLSAPKAAHALWLMPLIVGMCLDTVRKTAPQAAHTVADSPSGRYEHRRPSPPSPDIPKCILARTWSNEAIGGYNCQNVAMNKWQDIRARAKEKFEKKNEKEKEKENKTNCTRTYPLTVTFRYAATGNRMGELEIESEASTKAHVEQLLTDMKEGKIQGIERLPHSIEYRLIYDGKVLENDDLLDYIATESTPTVNVVVIGEEGLH